MKRSAALVAVFVLLVAAFLLLFGVLSTSSFRASVDSDQSRTNSQVLRATLGGLEVAIPAEFASYVEYDGEPSWIGAEDSPSRSASSLKSFGFNIDLVRLLGDGSTMQAEKPSSASDTSLFIHIISGEIFPGSGFLDRWVGSALEIPNIEVATNNYEKLAVREFGLDVYAPAGIDPLTDKPYREDRYAYDVYVHENELGNVETIVRCSNRPVANPPCEQRFTLEPKANAEIGVTYSRKLISSWQEIQNSVSKLIVGFEATEEDGLPQ